MENLAWYFTRASFSQERMSYHLETDQVEYRSKDGKQTKMLHTLEWLDAMCSQVPNKGEHIVRYYGYNKNAVCWKRKKSGTDDQIRCMVEPELSAEDVINFISHVFYLEIFIIIRIRLPLSPLCYLKINNLLWSNL